MKHIKFNLIIKVICIKPYLRFFSTGQLLLIHYIKQSIFTFIDLFLHFKHQFLVFYILIFTEFRVPYYLHLHYTTWHCCKCICTYFKFPNKSNPRCHFNIQLLLYLKPSSIPNQLLFHHQLFLSYLTRFFQCFLLFYYVLLGLAYVSISACGAYQELID